MESKASYITLTLATLVAGLFGLMQAPGTHKGGDVLPTVVGPVLPDQSAIVFGSKLSIRGIPEPQQMMRVVQGAPFTVPSGKLFVVTGVLRTDPAPSGGVEIFFDGSRVASPFCDLPSRTTAIPPGLTAPERTAVSCFSNQSGTNGIVLGYLVDA